MTLSDSVLQWTSLSARELKLEIAVMLFQKEKLTLAQAGRMAGMDRIAFQRLLAGRGISVHYGVEEFSEDIETLNRLGRL